MNILGNLFLILAVKVLPNTFALEDLLVDIAKYKLRVRTIEKRKIEKNMTTVRELFELFISILEEYEKEEENYKRYIVNTNKLMKKKLIEEKLSNEEIYGILNEFLAIRFYDQLKHEVLC